MYHSSQSSVFSSIMPAHFELHSQEMSHTVSVIITRLVCNSFYTFLDESHIYLPFTHTLPCYNSSLPSLFNNPEHIKSASILLLMENLSQWRAGSCNKTDGQTGKLRFILFSVWTNVRVALKNISENREKRNWHSERCLGTKRVVSAWIILVSCLLASGDRKNAKYVTRN